MDRGPLFLERRSYRRRRMLDALRFLPFLGLGLWMLPLLWPVAAPLSPPAPGLSGALDPEAAGALATSVTLKYVFGIWAALILAALGLKRRGNNPAAAGRR
ncbi:hypothetical protein ACFSUD_10040 [Sulfitobacter aestuarii]|uniref:Uncharacterized protein n=1 Tax=Sulfitobacter aestuarii TaxID=2161676 RepID=A0ABW5U264_9RHOB